MSNLGVGSGTKKEKKLLTGAPGATATAVLNLLIEREISRASEADRRRPSSTSGG